MIARTNPAWQNELAQAIRDPAILLSRLNLEAKQLPALLQDFKQFPLRVTESYFSRMQKGNPNDPLLLQVLPQARELDKVDGFSINPVGDQEAIVTPGLLHKYHGRCLLIVTAACAVHCRYCFRRHYPYQESHLDESSLIQAINYIQNDNSIKEVILSGGDPLSLSDKRLAELIHKLDAIPHLKRLRIHSRQPVVLPSRVSDELLQILKCSRLQKIMVLHFNHVAEFDNDVATAMNKLKQNNITLLNQSVLLKGVNDSVDALAALSEKLSDNHIQPYYLHLLDKVSGAAHFNITETQAKVLHRELRAALPGYLVPLFVQEERGKANKTPI